MSNFLAIASVTETLRQLLDAAVRNTVAGASATAVRPAQTGTSGGQPSLGVNLFLYQITPNAAYRNMDLPMRRGDGSLSSRPQAAIDLHYLFTFYGQDGQLEPQRILGRVLQIMHAQPLLSRDQIRNTITSVSYLADSNLAEQVESVKFSPLPLSLEELSKLWSVFFQSTYVLSVAYQGTVVLIEADDLPQDPLPVRERRVRVIPFQTPVIEDLLPIVCQTGDVLTISGQHLRSDAVQISFDGQAAMPPATISDQTLTIKLPANLQAGIRQVRVIQAVDFKTGTGEPHTVFKSNIMAFALAPTIAVTNPPGVGGAVTLKAGDTLTLSVQPPIAPKQDVRLLLNRIGVPLASRVAGSAALDQLQFTIPAEFSPGTYFVRLEVDGAQSQLLPKADPNNNRTPTDPPQGYTGPKVTITQ